MIVHFLAAYYSNWAHTKISPRSPQHQEAFNFCRSVKTGRMNEPISFPWKAGLETIERDDISRARIIFGMFIRKKIFDCGIRNPVLVPVPSKDGLFDSLDFRSYQMLREALQGDRQYPIVPAVRFTENLMPARGGGTRECASLLPYLTLTSPLPKGNVVIVDDILTTGGSIKAITRRLNEASIRVFAAIVCGYTVHKPSFPAFGDRQIRIELEEESTGAEFPLEDAWHLE